MNEIFLMPFWVRVAIVLFLLIVVVWAVIRKKALWVLSFLPFLFRMGFRYIFLVIEIPIAGFHKKFGSGFYKIDNGMSWVGEKVDLAFARWYGAWHDAEKSSFGRRIAIYMLCTAFVVAPGFLKIEDGILKSGEAFYIGCETVVVDWLKEHEWYESAQQAVADLNAGEQPASETIEEDSIEITLIVSGVRSSLLVRSVPSMKKSKKLCRLKNGDAVFWRGELVFAEADDEHVEPWVKVVTSDGIEGWSRLFYLHPQEYQEREFEVIGKSS